MRPILPVTVVRPGSVARDDRPLRVAIFGAGKAARFHLVALDQIPGVEVAGVCSRSGSTAEALVAGRPGAVATSNPDDLIGAPGIDAAIVAVPHELTAGLTRSLLEVGTPVLVEKPAALSSAEADDLARLAAERPTLALVAVNRRYYSLVQQALAIVAQRGAVRGVVVEGHEQTDTLQRQGNSDPELTGNWLLLNSIHFIDLLRVVGGDVDEVASVVRAVRVPAGDHLSASMRFAGGAVGTYVAHWNSAAPPMLRIYGEECFAEVTLSAPEDAYVQFFGKRRIRLHADAADQGAKPGVLEQDLAFLRAVSTGSTSAPFPASDLADHAASLRLVEAIRDGR